MTVWQFETADSGLPTSRTGCLSSQRVILVRVPERAVVTGIDVHRGVVSPARVCGRLHATAVDDGAFAQSHHAQRIAGEPPRVATAWKNIYSVYYAITKSHVPFLVLRDAAHPAMHAVAWGVRPLLVNTVCYGLRWSAVCPPDPVPTGAGNAGCRLDRLVGH